MKGWQWKYSCARKLHYPVKTYQESLKFVFKIPELSLKQLLVISIFRRFHYWKNALL